MLSSREVGTPEERETLGARVKNAGGRTNPELCARCDIGDSGLWCKRSASDEDGQPQGGEDD